jgi:hypothetical protein
VIGLSALAALGLGVYPTYALLAGQLGAAPITGQ